MKIEDWLPTSPWRRSVPVLMQNEVAECGLACIAMIAGYHGQSVDLAQLRRRFSTSARGASLGRLMEIAHALGLDGRPLRIELEHLDALSLPCVLHWDVNHFVVLTSLRKGVVTIHDPGRGLRRIPVAELDRHVTGVVLELTPNAGFERVDKRERLPFAHLLGRVRGLGRIAVQMLALALLLEMFTLLIPFALQWVMDEVLVSADLDLLALIAIGFLAVVALQAGTSALRGVAISAIGGSLNAQWTQQLFGHLLRLPMSFFGKRQVGDVMSRFASLQAIQSTLTGSFIESVIDGATAVLVLALLVGFDTGLGALVFGGFCVYALLRWIGYRRLWLLKEAQLTHTAHQQTLLLESVYAVQTIKLANAEADRQARLGNATIAMLNRDVALQRTGFAFAALQQWMFGSLRIVLIALTAREVLAGRFSAGMLVSFLFFADLFAARTTRLVDKLIELAMLRLHAERIADIALTEPEACVVSQYSGPQPEPTIAVQGLGFRYSDADPWILRDLSFTIPARKALAIVGPSGCGKSTLAKLLLGLLPPSEGCILIDGIDIRHFGLGAYRALFGSVMQDDQLLTGSIADNISFFDSCATPERIAEAARIASIDNEIRAMPMGYESLVGDMGAALSGGQVQRLLLARALYRRTALLLLDEATSHLDVPRERLVNGEIASLNCTRILIAHRPETIASADQVLVLEPDGAALMSPQQYLPALQARIRSDLAASPRGGP
jgi:ATP-binding cassette, subfamily B, bacterial CvaB/MchF/RaxB